MYDKYNSLTPFTVGPKLIKHKGMVISAASAATLTTHVLNNSGNTGIATFALPIGVTILPIEFYAVTNLGGMTGWLLN